MMTRCGSGGDIAHDDSEPTTAARSSPRQPIRKLERTIDTVRWRSREPDQVSLAGITVQLDTMQTIAVSLALLVPAGYVASRIWTMVSDRDQRRGIGIL